MRCWLLPPQQRHTHLLHNLSDRPLHQSFHSDLYRMFSSLLDLFHLIRQLHFLQYCPPPLELQLPNELLGRIL